MINNSFKNFVNLSYIYIYVCVCVCVCACVRLCVDWLVYSKSVGNWLWLCTLHAHWRRQEEAKKEPISSEHGVLKATCKGLKSQSYLNLGLQEQPLHPKIRLLVDLGLPSHSSLPKHATTKPPRQTWVAFSFLFSREAGCYLCLCI